MARWFLSRETPSELDSGEAVVSAQVSVRELPSLDLGLVIRWGDGPKPRVREPVHCAPVKSFSPAFFFSRKVALLFSPKKTGWKGS